MAGKLYGVGVGPGDPELVTLKAKRILEKADYIAMPKTASDKDSVALSIAEEVLDTKKPILELLFFMSFDSEVVKAGWRDSISKIKEKLDKGKDVAFITLGDPTVYSTYMYIHKEIKNQGYDTEIVPGITSFCAVTAKLGISLAENRESVAVIPSAYECKNIETILDNCDNVVMMKVSRNLPKIKEKLKEIGLMDKAVLVSKCGFPDEIIQYDIEKAMEKELSYFTTMIVKRKGVK
ncbi:precorrin-2 C20-methyltransferase [Lutispora thermophila DSM 19022]|uniref:Precorrin-2 C20-methyltransferase n=1 Tax=Lutispora thermophila DSM 19022 TaxID=1122184 RepID=A0A1M6D3D9_9FIRM|nr:precorrin-2 C20-methyltransferase [Lutispora thermophila DSM 19022]